MLGISLESFILLRVTVFVYGGGEVAAVNAELVPRPQRGAAASRDVLRVAALLMTIDDFRNTETSFVGPQPAPDLSTEQSIAVTSEFSRKSVQGRKSLRHAEYQETKS